MADKPSRGLVIYGDGLARFIAPSHSHIHSFASRACCGFLALPHSPPSESEDARIVREFAQLLDASEAYISMSGQDTVEVKSRMPMISERFMGMRAALVSNNPSLASFGSKLGLTVLQLNEFVESSHPSAESGIDVVAIELLKLLGFHEGKVLDTCQFDLIFIHIVAGEKISCLKDTEFLNDLVGRLINIEEPRSEIGSRLLMSVIMGYGAVSNDDDSGLLSVLIHEDENNPHFSLLFPHQSYTMKGANQRKNVRHHCPMLLAQWQTAVTRKDMVETFFFEDFKERCGNLTIPADRVLHEVAFKLWKAPKYGA